MCVIRNRAARISFRARAFICLGKISICTRFDEGNRLRRDDTVCEGYRFLFGPKADDEAIPMYADLFKRFENKS